MKLALGVVCMIPMLAQTGAVHVDYTCTPEDIDAFGMECSEQRPCQIFFEVSAVESIGSSVFVAGDIHTATTTLYGVLLSTDDGGVSWSESIARMKSATFEQFQIRQEHAWLSGHRLEPLAKDPFLLITTNGGKDWHVRPLFEEARFGSITQFWFDTPLAGQLVFDASVGKDIKQELYSTMTGGESWEIKQTSTKPLKLEGARASGWTVSAAAGAKTYLIERSINGRKETLARFLIHIGDCK